MTADNDILHLLQVDDYIPLMKRIEEKNRNKRNIGMCQNMNAQQIVSRNVIVFVIDFLMY